MPVKVEGPYQDKGTGAYKMNEKPVTYSQDYDEKPTGAVEGPPAETVYVSEDHEGKPTGAAPNPEERTYYQFPAEEPKSESKGLEAKAENKVVKQASTKSGAKKK